MNKKNIIAIIGIFVFLCTVNASITDYSPKLYTKKWGAKWSGNENYNSNDYRVLHFRRSFDLTKKPETFKINVSADNRFRLYVNGKSVACGPARGGFHNWHYDTLDIASHLKVGKNTIAAMVWHGGKLAPYAQLTRRFAFILDGATEAEDFLATPNDWKVKESSAYTPVPTNGGLYTGAGDDIDASKFDWGWTSPDFDDSKWGKARGVERANSLDTPYGEVNYILTPRKIPQMQETPTRMAKIRKSEGISNVPNFISGNAPLTIPANTKCKILIDNGVLTTAYPVLISDGGAGSCITLKYAEALYDKDYQKGNRNDIDGRIFHRSLTFSDIFRPDSGANREFSTLWWRTYRYVELDIQTKSEPLVIKDFYGNFTAYPFTENGRFSSDDGSIAKIWEVGWRTARLCANEIYMDCPYYEQLQYVGDTRIQSLISLYVSGDDRLMRQAISAFNLSRSSYGITNARYPSSLEQYIPPFSLYWISMVNDYAKFRNDPAFVKEMLAGVRSILAWYSEQIDPKTGILKARVPFWGFVDWCKSDPRTKGENSTGWSCGAPPEGENAGSAITTLHLALTLCDAADLMRQMGDCESADKYIAQYKQIIANVRKRCWNAERKIFMDFEGAQSSSQHVNIMAILADALPADEQSDLMDNIIHDKSLTQCTFYYRFYLTEAMRKAGWANTYISQLKPWYDMIDIGLTTFAENPEPTRSDCHAWSSSPNYHLLSLVCGIMPDGYGFKRVKIAPNFGTLNHIEGVVPHMNGKIQLRLDKKSNGGVVGEITLPSGISGNFIWKNNEIKLSEGINKIEL